MTDVRTRRLRILADLLRGGLYASQEEVTAELNRRGYPVTQATVSRDLEAVGAVKVKRGGILSYAPINITVPEAVSVQYIDPVVHLQRITYYA